MLLIADSGSTKTDWCLINPDQSLNKFKTEGLNPFLVEQSLITEVLQSKLDTDVAHKIKKVYFYGAGCTPGQKSELVQYAISKVCTTATILVASDLLGAARATCGHQKGLVCILGTGSNTGIFNGKEIERQIPSLGYLLGDEGGGAYIGKRLLSLYLRKQLPVALAEIFDAYFLDSGIAMPAQQLYKEKYPNRWLAGLLICLQPAKEDLFLKKVVRESIVDLFQHVIIHYPDCKKYKLSAVGSVAFYFKNELEAVCERFSIGLELVLQSPLNNLVMYHAAELEK